MKYFLLSLFSLASAFQPTLLTSSRRSNLFSSVEEPFMEVATEERKEVVTYFEDLVKAVKASTKFGLYGSETLHELADKVEAGADTCMWETDPVLCEKEIKDRLDVADILRLQAELQLRMDYIKGASIFASDTLAEEAIRQRDELLEYLAEDGV